MRQMWLDDLYIDMVNTGLDQVRAVFDLINPENQKENPDDICAQPSTQCRIDTVLSGSMSRGLPACENAPPTFTVDGAFPKSSTHVVDVLSRDRKSGVEGTCVVGRVEFV